MGKKPMFMYCVLCSKTIFYPLAHWLTGTNMCLRCNALLGKLPRPIERIKRKALAVYYFFIHDWYVEKGFAPYNLNEAPTVVLLCRHCPATKVVGIDKVGENEKEAIKAIVDLCQIRNVLRGKTYYG
ncbi:hypothetical protein LCGC14_0416740 [marine sediment metagenome]|uniref:Uncharacterized protein n=1 Tax=marine sediment metagenome TaxID=412755 RepID=A0A0F9SS79_9ZZZZ